MLRKFVKNFCIISNSFLSSINTHIIISVSKAANRLQISTPHSFLRSTSFAFFRLNTSSKISACLFTHCQSLPNFWHAWSRAGIFLLRQGGIFSNSVFKLSPSLIHRWSRGGLVGADLWATLDLPDVACSSSSYCVTNGHNPRPAAQPIHRFINANNWQ